MSKKRNGLPTLREIVDRLGRIERGGGLGGAGGNPAFEASTTAALNSLDTRTDATEAASALIAAGLVNLAALTTWMHGFVAYGTSWGAEINPNGTYVSPQNLDRWWPQMLRKRFGYADNRYTLRGSDYQVAANAISQVQCGRGGFPQVEGQISSVYMWARSPILGLLGGYRVLNLFTNRGLAVAAQACASVPSHPNNIPANTKWHVPFVNINAFETLRITPGDGFLWANNFVGTGRTDDGEVVTVVLNGGDYSNHCRGSSMLCQTGLLSGGWGEIDAWEVLRVRGAGAPQAAFDGRFDPTKATSRLPIFTPQQNDMGAGADKACIQETTRFCLSIVKGLYRYPCDDPTITRTGPWTTFTGSPATGALGKMDYLTGGTGTYEIAIPSTYKAGTPIALYYGSAPSRTGTINMTNGDTDFTCVGLNLTADDELSTLIAGAGIPAGTTIATVLSPTHGKLSANATATASGVPVVVGVGGGSGPITIDGGPPDFAGGVRINNTQSATVNTDQVTPFNGGGRVGLNRNEPGFPAVRMIPMARVITGLPDGAHTIRQTISSFPSAASVSRFYQNGWGYEAVNPSPPVILQKQPTLMVTAAVYAITMHGATGAANIATRNGWIQEVLDEFEATGRGNNVFIPLDTLMVGQQYFDSGGSHPSPKGHQLIEQATYEAIQSLTSALLSAS